MSATTVDHDCVTAGPLIARLAPSGRILLQPGPAGEGPGLPDPVCRRILRAFDRGRGNGVLHLGTAELETPLHPTLVFWRDLGRSLVDRICSEMDIEEPDGLGDLHPDPDELDRLALARPPMAGAERITPDLLGRLWSEMLAALRTEIAATPGGLPGYLEQNGSPWHVVGRISFHLAENKRDPVRPFAFLATYSPDLTDRARPRHLPLGRALQEYAGARNRSRLLALLAPLSRAAERSDLVRELVDSGEVYHPLAWTTREAYRLLKDEPVLRQAGLVLRLPDWWKRRSRPRVQVSVGEERPARLGRDSLLDFDVRLTLDGETLTEEEIRSLLSATDGLALIRGSWVEVDPDRLEDVLEHWQGVGELAREEGVGFGQAMRLLAGAEVGDPGGEAGDGRRIEWSEVVAGKWLSARLEELRSPRVRAEIEAGAGLEAKLRPYQKIGVEWLWSLWSLELGGCLADDMGLGKTIQVLGVLSLLHRRGEEGSDLLVVPASLVDNWRLELERFAPALRALIAHPSHIPSRRLKQLPAGEVEGHHVVITTYGTLQRLGWMKERRWRAVILDEAQAIKNPSAKQTRAVKALDAGWRLALTGTPVENRLQDLWSIFDFLNPGLLGSAREFGRFCKSLAACSHDSYAPLRRLIRPYILRRLKTDRRVICDLPDKVEMTAHCLLTRPQAALYARSVEELRQTLESLDGIERRGAVLAFLMRFKQICNHPSQWLGDGSYKPGASGKFARLRELCEPMAARQDKVLVFTQFREMTGPLAEHLTEIFGRAGRVLHGGTPVRKRQGMVREFQEDDGVPFMVLSLKAGGTGLNLTAASQVIHFDRWWNPAVENQATDRAFRIGQDKNVLVHKFVCRGTVEERIDRLIADKQALSEEVLAGGAEKSLTELGDEELLEMVSLDLGRATER